MAKRDKLLCKYCKGPEQFQAEYLGNRLGTRWGVRCQLTPGLPIRSFDTEAQSQYSIDEWCTGDGRRGCQPYLLRETGHSVASWKGDLLREFDAMEERTVAKQTYYCKCGKTFQKSSTAESTGYRLDGYGQEHDCYGCPFVEPVQDWSTGAAKTYECRTSADKVSYVTTASMELDSDRTARVYTLDMAWLDFFINFYLDTPGCGRSITDRNPDKLEKAFRNAYGYLAKGRRSYSFEFEKNKRGREARRIVADKFFNEKGEAYQLGCGPTDPKVRVLQMIELAKQEAKEGDDMAKIEVPKPSESTCPYYQGIEATYSPKGYCIDCTMRHGSERTPYELKSWALDAASKNCLDATAYSKCRFFLMAEQQSEVAAPVAEPQLPAPQEPAALVATEQRSINEVTAEIRYYKTQTMQCVIEIGKRLIEAKDMLEHGQWGVWLQKTVEFSQDTATNFMRLAQEYSNSEPVRNLSYTKLLALLAVPTEERDDFIEATHVVDGQEKTVDEMSKRELQRVIKERDEAKEQAKEAQRIASLNEQVAVQRRHELEALQEKQRQLKDENRRQQLDIQRLENQPIDVAVQPPTAAELESMRTVIRAEVIGEMGLPETYLAKKGIENATGVFGDAIAGAVANGMILAMKMPPHQAARTLDSYISTLVQHTQQLRDKLNIQREVDRNVKEGADDVNW